MHLAQPTRIALAWVVFIVPRQTIGTLVRTKVGWLGKLRRWVEAFEKHGMRVQFGGSNEAVMQNAENERIYTARNRSQTKQFGGRYRREEVEEQLQ